MGPSGRSREGEGGGGLRLFAHEGDFIAAGRCKKEAEARNSTSTPDRPFSRHEGAVGPPRSPGAFIWL